MEREGKSQHCLGLKNGGHLASDYGGMEKKMEALGFLDVVQRSSREFVADVV